MLSEQRSGTSKLPPTERGPVAEKTGFAWTRSHECGTPAAGRGGTKAPAQLPLRIWSASTTNT